MNKKIFQRIVLSLIVIMNCHYHYVMANNKPFVPNDSVMGGDVVGNGGNDISISFYNRLLQTGDNLYKMNKKCQSRLPFDVLDYLTFITKVESVKTSKKLCLYPEAVKLNELIQVPKENDPQCNSGQWVDAINYPKIKTIVYNSEAFKTSKEPSQLIIHEVLGLLEIEDVKDGKEYGLSQYIVQDLMREDSCQTAPYKLSWESKKIIKDIFHVAYSYPNEVASYNLSDGKVIGTFETDLINSNFFIGDKFFYYSYFGGTCHVSSQAPQRTSCVSVTSSGRIVNKVASTKNYLLNGTTPLEYDSSDSKAENDTLSVYSKNDQRFIPYSFSSVRKNPEEINRITYKVKDIIEVSDQHLVGMVNVYDSMNLSKFILFSFKEEACLSDDNLGEDGLKTIFTEQLDGSVSTSFIGAEQTSTVTQLKNGSTSFTYGPASVSSKQPSDLSRSEKVLSLDFDHTRTTITHGTRQYCIREKSFSSADIYYPSKLFPVNDLVVDDNGNVFDATNFKRLNAIKGPILDISSYENNPIVLTPQKLTAYNIDFTPLGEYWHKTEPSGIFVNEETVNLVNFQDPKQLNFESLSPSDFFTKQRSCLASAKSVLKDSDSQTFKALGNKYVLSKKKACLIIEENGSWTPVLGLPSSITEVFHVNDGKTLILLDNKKSFYKIDILTRKEIRIAHFKNPINNIAILPEGIRLNVDIDYWREGHRYKFVIMNFDGKIIRELPVRN